MQAEETSKETMKTGEFGEANASAEEPLRGPEAAPAAPSGGGGGAGSSEEEVVLPGDSESIFGAPPKHVLSGVGQAVTSVVAGVGAGAAVLVGAPIVGAREGGGVGGFAKGCGVGVLGALALPVVGAASGLTSFVRGVVATPYAVKGAVEGKEWDAVTGQWVVYDLEKEAALLLSSDAEELLKAHVAQRRARRKREAEELAKKKTKKSDVAQTLEELGGREEVKEAPSLEMPESSSDTTTTISSNELQRKQHTALYEELGVQIDATEGEIKRAYYQAARRYHPDRESGLEEKFEACAVAYQVLTVPEARAHYDATGDVAALEVPASRRGSAMMDPAVFHALVFGSDAFEQYVGELALATSMRRSEEVSGQDGPLLDALDAAELAFVQRQRRVKLAKHLATTLDKYAASPERPTGSEEFERSSDKARLGDFEASVRRDVADELAKTPFGAMLVRVMAGVYSSVAERYLAGALKGTYLDAKSYGHECNARGDALAAAVRAMESTRRVQRAAEKAYRAEADRDAKWDRTETLDGAPLHEALYCVVAETAPDGEWHTSLFKTRNKADAYFDKRSWRRTAVMFQRDLGPHLVSPTTLTASQAPPLDSWTAVRDYGSTATKKAIKREVVRSGLARVDVEDVTAAAAGADVQTKLGDMMQDVVEAAWRLSVLDIETTLHDSTSKVLRDASVDTDARKRRADALLVFAKALTDAADAADHHAKWQDHLLNLLADYTAISYS